MPAVAASLMALYRDRSTGSLPKIDQERTSGWGRQPRKVYRVAGNLRAGTATLSLCVENIDPWQQCGDLVSCIHETKGEQERISAFHRGCGVLEQSAAIQFRQEAYKAMHVGSFVVWSAKNGNREDVEQGHRDLERIAGLLQAY